MLGRLQLRSARVTERTFEDYALSWYVVLEKGTRAVLVTGVSHDQAVHLAHCIQAQDGRETFVERDDHLAKWDNIAAVYRMDEIERRGWAVWRDDAAIAWQ